MNRRKFLQAATATAATAVAGCGSSGPEEVTLQIDGSGEWSGSIGSAGSSRSVQGWGRESWTFQEVPDIVSATVQKGDRGMWTLTVTIFADGEAVTSSSTSAEFGVASVSEMI